MTRMPVGGNSFCRLEDAERPAPPAGLSSFLSCRYNAAFNCFFISALLMPPPALAIVPRMQFATA